MLGRRNGRVLASSGPLVLALLVSACSSAKATPRQRQAVTPMASHPQELWGDLKPVVSVKELMRDMINPASDFVFDAVGTVLTRGKRIDKIPKTDADWDRIRIGAVTMAEGAYLLKIPRPFAPREMRTTARVPSPPNSRRRRSQRSSWPTPCCGMQRLKHCGTLDWRSWRSSSVKTSTSCGMPAKISIRRARAAISSTGIPVSGRS